MRYITLLTVFVCSSLVCLGQPNFAAEGLMSDTLKTQIKLTEVKLTPDCGTFAWTAAQKFELLQNGVSATPKKYIIVLQRCPEFLGRKFFVRGRVYKAVLVAASDDKGAMNSYMKEKLATYSCVQIQPI